MSNTEHTIKTLPGKASGRSTWRMYIYRLDTREEVAAFGWDSTSEAGIKDGVRYTDTAMRVTGWDLKTLRRVEITADSFPFPVAVKVWHA